MNLTARTSVCTVCAHTTHTEWCKHAHEDALFSGSGEDDDGEPDKMAIAGQRVSRFVACIKRGVGGFFRGIMNRIVRLVRGRPLTHPDIALEVTEEKDFQVTEFFSDHDHCG